MQALFLPVMALSFAVAPVVGQNFGGRRADRVRHSVYSAIGIASLMMVVLTLIAYLAPATLIRIFSRDPRVIAFGSEYLRIVSFNFISTGIVFTTSSVFQGIGNTLPPLFSSLTRLVLFAVPALLISRMPGFEIREVWYLSVGTVIFQMCINFFCSGTSCGKGFDSTNRKISFPRALRLRRFTESSHCAFTARRKPLCRRRSWFSLSRCEWLPVSAQRCCRSISPCPRVCPV